MAIVCNKCRYVLSQTEILTHVVYDICDAVQQAAPTIVTDMVSSCILQYIQKRGYIENIALTTANRQKVICTVCMKYKGWTKIQNEDVDSKKIA